MDPYFASMNGHPVRGTFREAWELIDGAWVRVDSTDTITNAALTTEADFTARFGTLPPLPTGAFQPIPRSSR